MCQILYMDETCILLNESNVIQGGCLMVTDYDKRLPQLENTVSKMALMTTMISGSNAVADQIAPNFQFQMSAQ